MIFKYCKIIFKNLFFIAIYLLKIFKLKQIFLLTKKRAGNKCTWVHQYELQHHDPDAEPDPVTVVDTHGIDPGQKQRHC